MIVTLDKNDNDFIANSLLNPMVKELGNNALRKINQDVGD